MFNQYAEGVICSLLHSWANFYQKKIKNAIFVCLWYNNATPWHLPFHTRTWNENKPLLFLVCENHPCEWEFFSVWSLYKSWKGYEVEELKRNLSCNMKQAIILHSIIIKHQILDAGFETNWITKVRISIGASSTVSAIGSTGRPLLISASFRVDGPSTFHTSLFLSISLLSWLADKLTSATLLIWKQTRSIVGNELNMSRNQKAWLRVHCF